MGCICSKGILLGHYKIKGRGLKRSKSSKRFAASSRRDELAVTADGGGHDGADRLIPSPHEIENEVGDRKGDDFNEKPSKSLQRRATMDVQLKVGKVGSFPLGEKAAQVVAGWPSWLTAVAGEAINGWVPRRADSFEKLEKIGQGTYSSVYRARDLETNTIVALKKVRFANMDPESVRFMAREIIILRKLDHPNVMKLEGLITSRVSGSLYLVFEYMDHDLAGLAATHRIKFTESQIKCYMQQLLRGLEYCHSHGVLHRDIKGSNLLVDNNGNLKIGDFGLATFFRTNQNQPLTSRVVTLWYRPPELLLGSSDYGVSVDLWSSGCILAELFAGKPIMPGRTEVEQMHKIFKLCGSPSEEYWKKSKLPHATIFKPQQPYKRCLLETFKDFPSSALALLDVLLAVEPECRGTASSALLNDFFTSNPLPCDPSSLPKYPSSKEFDARLRDEEARKRKATAGKVRGLESIKKCSKESKVVPMSHDNADFKASIQERQGQSNPRSTSEKLGGTTQNNVTPSGQSAEPSLNGSSQIGNANEGEALTVTGRELDSSSGGAELTRQRSFMHRRASRLSRFSNSVAVGADSLLDCSRETGANVEWRDEAFVARCNYQDGGESSGKHDWSHHLLHKPMSLFKKAGEHPGRESIASYSPKKSRIHYSGPLLPAGGNLDEMLKEHERQIQNAVRKARLDKVKTTNHGQVGALFYWPNGR
ncbi:probable serine/threonine-protein kinase At1g09600 isoform X1 [Rhodamnia argentea]|uniref:Probable serine/threonine-protein kinase At1g09600 isoform X1 n=1 Tax=Rhodamnia argentea TaxID=178133 RepID=A0A8B8MYM5_9MYRT|nr:probable serine/threonine-protein kinase At1g09600 isoform X1 [Rhodamnia argentea]